MEPASTIAPVGAVDVIDADGAFFSSSGSAGVDDRVSTSVTVTATIAAAAAAATGTTYDVFFCGFFFARAPLLLLLLPPAACGSMSADVTTFCGRSSWS